MAAAVLAVVVLLLCLFAGLALASDPAPDSEAQGLVVPDSAAALDALTEDSHRVVTEPQTDAAAAEELPHSDLDRNEAENLLLSVFPSALEEQAGVFNDLEVEAFRSDHVAVVPPDGPAEEPGLLSSLLPLRVDNGDGVKEVVDLDLSLRGETFEPVNPLVDVRIPESLDQEVRLPEVGLGVQFGAGTDRSASVISQNAAFYPNIAEETDLSILPTPTGLETLTQLRSSQAPRSQKLELDLPAGAALRETEDGGAVVDQGEEASVVVRPPTAIDAAGEPVSVKMEVSGASLLLEVEPDEDAAYPILVDPVFESYSWMNSENKTGIYEDWLPYTSNSNVFKPGWIGTIGGQFRFGLALRSSAGATAPGTSMYWNYYVPRYLTDKENPAVNERPTSYIKNMTLSQVYFVLEDSPVHDHPYLTVGLWDANKGQYASYGDHGGWAGGYSGVTLSLPNPGEYTDVKNGGFALSTSESASYPRQAFVGSASVEVSDRDSPGWGELGSVGEWISSQTKDIPYKATDTGLGIHDLRIRYAAARGGPAEGMITIGCTGAASSACPRTSSSATKPFLFDGGAISQGENWVNLYAVDPVGHWSEVGVSRIKIDREPPELSLSGDLTDQKNVGTNLSQYSLRLDVKDGDEATAAATTPVGIAGTAAGQLERPWGVAVDGSGDTWVTDRVNNRLVEYDKNGTFVRQTGGPAEAPIKEPRMIDVAPNGNLLVAEVTAKRIRQFTQAGTPIASITNSSFVEPFGVAVGPEGTIWVTDIYAKKIFQFKQDGTLIRSFNSPSIGSTDKPLGIDVDEFGNGWVAIQGSNRVVELSPTGSELFSFGGEGTAAGKLNGPQDVEIASSGNILVSDGSNNRIQVFKPDGTFMRQLGSTGTTSGQFNEPRGIAIGPGNQLVVADASNKRVARWTHADRHIESGAVKTEIKVDGTLADTYNPGCAGGKNCALSREWVMKADNYSVGSHKVDVIATDGAGIKAENSLTVETHGDRTAPTVALTGSITEQAALGKTLPAYTAKVAASDPAVSGQRQSGVAKIEILVDGKVVDSVAPGCPAGGCSLNREWTLKSSGYSFGWHWMEVIATDAAGKTSSRFREFEIKRDATAPELALSGPLPGAPEGWVQEGTHSATADATDQGGYGVKQIRFMIDGVLVGETASQTCEMGGCGKTTTFSVNMTPFTGGAHEAVMAAEDGAGNVRKKTWTINLDPEGNISVSEAVDTIEALENTTDANLLGSTQEESLPGTVDGLTMQVAAGGYEVIGNEAPTTVSSSPAAGLEVQIPAEGSASGICNDTNVVEGSAAQLTGAQEEALAAEPASTCSPISFTDNGELQPVTVVPINTGPQAAATLTGEKSATLVANQANSTDLITRPLFDGAMTFAAIREAVAPTEYSWRVSLEADQEMRLLDPQHAQVSYRGGPAAFSISAVPAHDAIGTAVPTSLKVEGTILTLTVNHRTPSPLGGSYVYPIVAGAGWEGGFEIYHIEMPTEVEEQLEVAEGGSISIFAVGPPSLAPAGSPGWEVASASEDPFERRYKFTYCWPKHIPGNPFPPGKFDPTFGGEGHARSSITPEASECHREDFHGIHWGVTVHGHYEYKTHDWVRVKSIDCDHWGEEQPKTLDCKQVSVGAQVGTKNLAGEYRFHQGKGDWAWESKPTCLVWGGEIYPRKAPANPKPYERPAVWLPKALTYHDEKCDWPSYENEAFG